MRLGFRQKTAVNCGEAVSWCTATARSTKAKSPCLPGFTSLHSRVLVVLWSSTSPGPLDLCLTGPWRCWIVLERSVAPHDVSRAQIRTVVFAQSSSADQPALLLDLPTVNVRAVLTAVQRGRLRAQSVSSLRI